MLGKNEKRIHSKAWFDLLCGENIEKPNTRVDEKSSIKYQYLERVTDEKTGAEYLVEVKAPKTNKR